MSLLHLHYFEGYRLYLYNYRILCYNMNSYSGMHLKEQYIEIFCPKTVTENIIPNSLFVREMHRLQLNEILY
jgi:hypothetical protein